MPQINALKASLLSLIKSNTQEYNLIVLQFHCFANSDGTQQRYRHNIEMHEFISFVLCGIKMMAQFGQHSHKLEFSSLKLERQPIFKQRERFSVGWLCAEQKLICVCEVNT